MAKLTYYVKFQHTRRGWRDTEPTEDKSAAEREYDRYMATSNPEILQVILIERSEREIG